jgi:maltose alpha-D-glucosyltransferase/alpha-amylase
MPSFSLISMVSKFTAFLFLMCVLMGCKPKPTVQLNIDAWYKHLLIYNLDVKTFKDSDGDGEGDFKGLTSKLNYLHSLGINTIWLPPFQPSPLQDDGYDITDYYGIDPKLGNIADFRVFLKQAKAQHIHVVMDIVLNHSSIHHPWFRSKPDWYLWSAKRPGDWDKGIGFPGVEKDTWHFDSVSHRYYFHRFYQFQPDLNYQNPAVIEEAKHIMAYWLDQGLEGFRLDAVPFIIDDPRKDAENPKHDFNILYQLSGFVQQHKPGAVLLGEANVDPKDNAKYFDGQHHGLQMMFNFYANQFLFYGLATGDATLFKKALNETKPKPGQAQWAWFLRNHDEIDLGRLSKHQLKEVDQKMGPDSSMQLYKRGIRRRLAPMLGNDPARLRMAYSLLYSLPGTPVIREGEELGMGEDLKLKERLAVRTPMQWDSTANSGFTTGQSFRPIINSGGYAYQKVNVNNELRDTSSLLNFIRHLIQLRKQYPEINNGAWQTLETGNNQVLVIQYADKGKLVLISHNFSDRPQVITLEDKRVVKLGRYGFQWQRLN